MAVLHLRQGVYSIVVDLEWVQLPDARCVEEGLTRARQVVVHDLLNYVQVLGLVLLDLLTQGLECLDGRFEVDHFLVNVLFKFVRVLCTLLLKFLVVLSKKSAGYRARGVHASANKASWPTSHHARVIHVAACQRDRVEF